MQQPFENTQDWHNFDRDHLWHPYTAMHDPLPTYPVVSADGVRIKLADGTELVDGMASWWAAIHGYGHPQLTEAAVDQLGRMSHVMFGGLSHEPASRLGAQLVSLTPEALQYVFFSDSGSVSVEVAMKMAIQYWHSLGEQSFGKQSFGKHSRSKFLTPRGGYHGDPFPAMSVSDPKTGMHQLFEAILPKQISVERPGVAFDQPWDSSALDDLERQVALHGDEVAAVILEPIVQGAGGMWFYHPEYLRGVRELCDREGLLLIVDEIATGFGRTGRMFASEHAEVVPDIMCVGKALTGGMVSLAATLTTSRVTDALAEGPHPVLMHGPTFMANPLACAISSASIELLLSSDWQANVERIENRLRNGLAPLAGSENVADVRILGAIGVVETRQPVDVAKAQQVFVQHGVWIRPFGRLIYVMPPFITADEDIDLLTSAIADVVAQPNLW